MRTVNVKTPLESIKHRRELAREKNYHLNYKKISGFSNGCSSLSFFFFIKLLYDNIICLPSERLHSLGLSPNIPQNQEVQNQSNPSF